MGETSPVGENGLAACVIVLQALRGFVGDDAHGVPFDVKFETTSDPAGEE